MTFDCFDCNATLERLDAWHERTLRADERCAVDRHLEACASCREFAGVMRDASSAAPLAPPPDLVRSVMRRTAGSACPAAHARLCDRVDGALSDGDRAILDDHVAHCRDCAHLFGALTAMTRDLPSLAELDPDATFVYGTYEGGDRHPALAARSFVEQVLDRTTNASRPAARHRSLAVRIGRFVDARLRRWVVRPRFAMEVSYVMTALLVAIVGIPRWSGVDVPDARDAARRFGRMPVAAVDKAERTVDGVWTVAWSRVTRAVGDGQEQLFEGASWAGDRWSRVRTWLLDPESSPADAPTRPAPGDRPPETPFPAPAPAGARAGEFAS